ncbi:hypothetical protein CYLTODRAFT_452453 [Cylindrobasidium torrendii FP15055 ss-10]|uniref:Uncharacterized protein n=1 Tax=Cylindrobasidium torrendii FP15055 ss-10 TaxID=1314674 RepID=A0A0D7BIW1_9AGAR|nr:hypothetical protein CYLTODRAFT_452453 [Cylindrobasidium torrendii FP15055 ss-10]
MSLPPTSRPANRPPSKARFAARSRQASAQVENRPPRDAVEPSRQCRGASALDRHRRHRMEPYNKQGRASTTDDTVEFYSALNFIEEVLAAPQNHTHLDYLDKDVNMDGLTGTNTFAERQVATVDIATNCLRCEQHDRRLIAVEVELKATRKAYMETLLLLKQAETAQKETDKTLDSAIQQRDKALKDLEKANEKLLQKDRTIKDIQIAGAVGWRTAGKMLQQTYRGVHPGVQKVLANLNASKAQRDACSVLISSIHTFDAEELPLMERIELFSSKVAATPADVKNALWCPPPTVSSPKTKPKKLDRAKKALVFSAPPAPSRPSTFKHQPSIANSALRTRDGTTKSRSVRYTPYGPSPWGNVLSKQYRTSDAEDDILDFGTNVEFTDHLANPEVEPSPSVGESEPLSMAALCMKMKAMSAIGDAGV